MPLLGAHQSIAGGFHNAVKTAFATGCDCVQIFTHAPQQWPVKPANLADQTDVRPGRLLTKNNNQWVGKAISEDDVSKFQQSLANLKIKHPIAHNSYLINLGSPDAVLWKKSIDAFVIELQRADQLGIPYVVAHPGAFTSSSEEAGLKAIVRALDEVHQQLPQATAMCLLETTAGQGSCLGAKFEHLATIIENVKHPDRLGVCVDTCHIFAAGYPLGTKKEYMATMKALDAIVGIDKVKAFHLNDSKAKFNSHVDRHEHIGRGQIGIEPFRFLMNDRRFKKVPMYLETPKGIEDGEELDVSNLRTLRGLVE